MNHPSDSSSSKPSLEALLRLKRAERPDEAFWSDFEANLRQKQLAAIIEPKPWWLGSVLALRKFSVPAAVATSGAAALLAFTVIRSGPPAPMGGIPISSAVTATPDTTVAFALPLEINPVQEVTISAQLPAASVSVAISDQVPTSAQAQSIPEAMEAGLVDSGEVPALLASADTVAAIDAGVVATLADEAIASDPVGLPMMVSEFPVMPFEREAIDGGVSVSWSDERVIMPASDFADLASEPATTFAINTSAAVADADTVAEAVAPGSRFERLLSADTQKVVSNSDGSFAQVRDRVLHRLGGDEELYASVSRLGLGGDRLSLRF